MKNKTIVTAVIVMALVSSMFLVAGANAACNLPATPVTLTVGSGPPPVTITLSGVPAGYDVTNGPYTGYCIELGIAVQSPATATLVCTDNAGTPWDEINYLFNNYPDNLDLQMAIWRLLGNSVAFIEAQGFPFTTGAGNMYTDASTNGVGFDPSAGDWVGVRCLITGEGAHQDLIIKIQIPGEERGPGLTPGFWKNNLAVYLGLANGNRGYSDPEGATEVTKDTMGAFFTSLAGTYDLNQLYRNLSPQLDGTTADIRNDAANIFNVAAGLSPGPPWN